MAKPALIWELLTEKNSSALKEACQKFSIQTYFLKTKSSCLKEQGDYSTPK